MNVLLNDTKKVSSPEAVAQLPNILNNVFASNVNSTCTGYYKTTDKEFF